MITNFFDNIYAASYKGYSKAGQSSPSFSAVTVVCLHLIGIFFLLVTICRNIFFNNYHFQLNGTAKTIAAVPLVVLLVLVIKYYSGEKSAKALENYDEKGRTQKIMWGIITISLPILEFTSIAIILSGK